MFFVYALYSPKYEKFYIGYSPDPEKRFPAHNDSRNEDWTLNLQAWFLVYTATGQISLEANAKGHSAFVL